LPDLIHLNPAPGKKGLPPPALTLLQAYGELIAKHPEYTDRYFAVLHELEHSDPGNPLVQGAIGNRELHAGKYEQAVAHLQQALKDGLSNTILYTDLAEALIRLDRKGEAVAVLEKATEVDPFNATLRKTLILQLIQSKDYVKAKMEMEDYVKRFPQDAFMRQMLARARGEGRSQ
jgi:predicted Zn-dependent protease